MASIKKNSDDWRELRSRVDSIANAVFLIAGGALSLSITVILGQKHEEFITVEVARLSIQSWYALLASVILFLVLKVHLVLEAYLLQFRPQFVTDHLRLLNGIGWLLGFLGFVAFVLGLVQIVRAAALAVCA